jgi:hypothetical protein
VSKREYPQPSDYRRTTRTYCVEAAPVNAKVLQKTASIGSWNNTISVIHAAVTNGSMIPRSGTFPFETHAYAFGDEFPRIGGNRDLAPETVEVRATTVDELVFNDMQGNLRI